MVLLASQCWCRSCPGSCFLRRQGVTADLHAPASCLQITFAVTSKDKKEGGPTRSDALRSVLSCVWPYLLWIAGFAAGICFFVVKACMGAYGPCECAAQALVRQCSVCQCGLFCSLQLTSIRQRMSVARHHLPKHDSPTVRDTLALC
jgi:hypothetical protein